MLGITDIMTKTQIAFKFSPPGKTEWKQRIAICSDKCYKGNLYTLYLEGWKVIKSTWWTKEVSKNGKRFAKRERREKRAFQVKGIGFIKAGRHQQCYCIVIKKKQLKWMAYKVIRQRVLGNEFGDEYTKEIINVFWYY